ncbi:hypothetical protein ACHHYP_08262 [Achlya hypogyna]|uniref:GP-PDE domain-containing protein n=1 Tax=Achlya hypogyna TaxID=1202772 RepID=A0A1V9ZL18_ACHHY|nr:hypothetical protein ACHHYP_08262 [Achlya hypogyna]
MLDELAEEILADAQSFAAYEATLQALPTILAGGATRIVADAQALVDAVAVSRRIMLETHALTTSALRYLANYDQGALLLAEYEKHCRARERGIAAMRERVHDVRRKWLHVGFRACQYPRTFEPPSVLPDVDDGASGAAEEPAVDEDLLSHQPAWIGGYGSNMKHAAKKPSREPNKKKPRSSANDDRLAHAARKRLENVQHRWGYLSYLVLRKHRLDRLQQIRRDRLLPDDADDGGDAAPNLAVATTFVESVVHSATLRVLWAAEVAALTADPLPLSSDAATVVRVCMLLCPSPFGGHFSAMYQRFFARECSAAGIAFDWRVFDVGRLEFPTRAQHDWAHGYLVCGGPGRVEGCWRGHLGAFVAHLMALDARIGALGQGHTVLAAAVGGAVARSVPSRLAWSLLEDKVPAQQTVKTAVRALPALHGDFVVSVPSAFQAATNAPNAAFVTRFKSARVLSFDGHPECGRVLLELLSREWGAPLPAEPAWPSGAGLVARKLAQLWGANATSGEDDPPDVLSRRLPARPLAIIAHKSADPKLAFLSDTVEYLAFAAGEGVDAVVLPLGLSRDGHPVVFPSPRLEALTDLPAVFPGLARAGRTRVVDLTLAELRALTILHSFAGGLKSPRASHGGGQTNRILALTAVLEHVARINATRATPLGLVFVFVEEDDVAFAGHTPPRRAQLWAVLDGALQVLVGAAPVHLLSRDATLLLTVRKLRPLWRFILQLPRTTAAPVASVAAQDAVAVARVADAILVAKAHPLLLPPVESRNESIVQLYHRAGVRVYVDLNDSVPTDLSVSNEPIRCQCLRADGVFVANPHTVLDGRRFFASGHRYIDDAYDELAEGFRLAAAHAEHEQLQREEADRGGDYAHHAYRYPFDTSVGVGLRQLPDVLDDALALLCGTNAAAECARQLAANSCAPRRPLQSLAPQPREAPPYRRAGVATTALAPRETSLEPRTPHTVGRPPAAPA